MGLKRAYIPFLCVILLSLSGCDAIYRMLDKEGAEEKELVGEVIPFEKNPTVKEIQTLLKIYGYNPGKIDGILGGRTRDTIARFQRENGLEESRFVDQQTWGLLSQFVQNGFIIDSKLDVIKVQQTLEVAGFKVGKIDGKFGAQTQQAVKAFQEAHNIKVDGKVGFQTLSQLSRYLDQSGDSAYNGGSQNDEE